MKSLSVAPCNYGDDDRKSLSILQKQKGGENRPLPTSRLTVDGDKIRSRLLMRLGFTHRQQQDKPMQSPLSRVPLTRKVAPFSVPLKYEEEGSEERNTSLSSGTGGKGLSPKSTRKSVVAFHNEVSVIPIPSHQVYSKRVRSSLWCDKSELRVMAARNTLEYQAEGWDPKSVVEDDDFITLTSGDKIHPVHLQRLLCSPYMRQPLRVIQLRQQQQVHQASGP